MRFYDFILLKRNDWAHDKRAIEENLDRVNKKDPLWLVVFPEGTVVSKGTRKRSTAFAEKAGLVSVGDGKKTGVVVLSLSLRIAPLLFIFFSFLYVLTNPFFFGREN